MAESRWMCSDCGTLLGIKRDGVLHVRYKEAQYVIGGVSAIVTSACRHCGAINALQLSDSRRKATQA